ncbi:MAG TPA: DNA-directed RNA polymerase subunit beta [Desulfobacteraceae bacterium]|nr:DNA-directed RNA polymerase subunit beta [Desulfobacteraceae bacterium]
MSEGLLSHKRIRKNFGKINRIVEIPDLISVQRKSYARFLQMDLSPEQRIGSGLQEVFKSVFPINDLAGAASLEFVSYSFGEVKRSEKECINGGTTYEVPLRITVRLVVYDIDPDTGTSNVRDIKEQEIYFGALPLMTKNGTFIVNGTERVVVSQLHRSSGVFFDHDQGKTHASGKVIYSARIIPVRGSWIDMEIDPKGIVYVRIDRRRKFIISILFKAFGYTSEDILSYFYENERIVFAEDHIYRDLSNLKKKYDLLRSQHAHVDILDPASGDLIVKKGRKFTRKSIKQMESAGVTKIPITDEEIIDRVFSFNIKDPVTGQFIVRANDVLDEQNLAMLHKAGITEIDLLIIDGVTSSESIHKCLLLDKTESKQDAILDIYRRLRPANPATLEIAQDFVDKLFFNSTYYDFSRVGRLKINQRLGIKAPIDLTVLKKEDIILTTKALVKLRDTQGVVDDIDHLGNRRVRSVGELLENQFRIGLVRMERAIKERMSLQEVDALMPNDLINPKPVSAVVREFFGTSQLSQFMDQTNPLTETTHKRRLSALGPGGLTRERAGFEVRDVHPSHYGRICPIETPEGPNIGLIVSLGTYARVNEFGFIETPYRVVNTAQVTDDVQFFDAFEEKEHPIAQANAPVDKEGKYINQLVTSRVAGEFMMVDREDIKLMDVSPNQLVSVSASLIPFLENDDANRALMGSNMQRQALPLMVTEAPIVGTDIEGVVAKDSGVTIVAENDGFVAAVEASRIIVKKDLFADTPVDIYNLSKFKRTNQNTCFNHRPIVKKGAKVKAGEILADGPATDMGELALGKNVTVAFMPWGGYNFEDSILLSERLVRDGVYTSVHIEELEALARDTKLGNEEITRDIPNIGEDALKYLDDSGIIKIGAKVKAGDILVGKITPKGETQLSPEERLLRAIFGEKAGDVKDTSLRASPGVEGIVIDAKIFSRRSVEKDERAIQIEQEEIAALKKNLDDEIFIIEDIARELFNDLLIGQVCHSSVKVDDEVIIQKGDIFDLTSLFNTPISAFDQIVLQDVESNDNLYDILHQYRDQCAIFRKAFERKRRQYEKGDDLLPGVIKMIKIYVAMKRKLSVGDKMAGRHGNKGVVSKILPLEDLPYFEDGTPVDMVLSPLGVPSRMNVGQILEIHLGRAAKALGHQVNVLLEERRVAELRAKLKRIFVKEAQVIDEYNDTELCDFAGFYTDGVHMATPVFDGAKEDEIKELLEEAGCHSTGQTTLFDGRTGEPFHKKITVGTMYMLKLHHLVDDKIHARSIGPYSLVTQQPLGGKAQFGGQRFGEMEVWAMEAYGTAFALQEFLTVKSDDIAGRTRMYERIVKGQNVLEPGIPESFRVLKKELMSLGLDVTLMEH